MTPEDIRKMIIAGNDALINTPILWRHLSAEQKRLTLAAREFWSGRNPVTTAALESLLDLYNDKSGCF